jgi:maltooligosyltrehalose trehalohydrolase
MPDFNRTGHTLGALYLGDGRTRFRVWAPAAQQMELQLLTPQAQTIPLVRTHGGYWQAVVDDVAPGALYVYRIDGERERPDPASRYQPDGVHGPSQVVNPDEFAWHDHGWSGPDLASYIIYELHVGTFTPEGTFEAMVPYLQGLRDLGVTAIELMPVAQFPGTRNWGYDGVGLFAVQNSYGGPQGLKQLVDAAHGVGLAVILDLVYNHLGAEGNYLWDFGPYFTDHYKTPWGSAVNFDGPGSDDVRRFFVDNALYWLTHFHVDALRLDAIHAILDFSAGTFLEELAASVERQRTCQNRRIYLIGESNRNDNRVVRPLQDGGFGLDAQWNDDFHHAVHALLTGEGQGYYQDFVRANGVPALHYLAKAMREGYVYSGQYSRYRQRRHGNSPASVPAYRFIVAIQNHDQIGNRMLGDRLSTLVPFALLKMAAGLLLLSPYVPLIFMGEEYGETNPFQYFVSHSDSGLLEAVRQGRQREFAAFAWAGDVPDPASEETFLRSKLCRQDAQANSHYVLYELYRELIRLRQTLPALANLSKEHQEVQEFAEEQVLYLRRWAPDGSSSQVIAAFNFSDEPMTVRLPVPRGRWRRYLDSSSSRWRSECDAEYLSEPLALVTAEGAHAQARLAKSLAGLPDAGTPEWLVSESAVTLHLHPAAFVLYVQEVTAHDS